jgi:hypothetical protein
MAAAEPFSVDSRAVSATIANSVDARRVPERRSVLQNVCSA